MPILCLLHFHMFGFLESLFQVSANRREVCCLHRFYLPIFAHNAVTWIEVFFALHLAHCHLANSLQICEAPPRRAF